MCPAFRFRQSPLRLYWYIGCGLGFRSFLLHTSCMPGDFRECLRLRKNRRQNIPVRATSLRAPHAFRAKKLDLKQYSLNHATPLVLRTTLIHWFQAHTLFRHAIFPFTFRLQVRRLTNWISLQSSTSTGNTSTPIRTHYGKDLHGHQKYLCKKCRHQWAPDTPERVYTRTKNYHRLPSLRKIHVSSPVGMLLKDF